MKTMTFSSKSSTSARRLRDCLQETLGEKILLTNKNKPKHEVIVNYGSGEHWINCDHNRPEFVSLCAGKYSFSRLLRENNFTNVPNFQHGRPTSYPAVIRETLTNCGGRGIHVCANEDEYDTARLSTNFWWTPYVKTSSEFRVHILGGEIVKVSKKVFRPEITDTTEPALPIRSHLQGYFFKLIENEWKKWTKLEELIHRLVPILNGSFYGLDLGYSTELHDYFIFEANSAPGLNQFTVQIYVQYLSNILLGGTHDSVHRAGTNN